MNKLLGRDVMIALKSDVYIGTITLSSDRYINIQAMEFKTATMIKTKIYVNEMTFMKPLKTQNQIKTDDCMDFTLQELTRMSSILSSYVAIQSFDSIYHTAIDEIESESFVGFYMTGIDRGRFADSSLVAISTSKTIFLFDVQLMGRIETKIKNILEANTPKKIVHDASRTADHLKHKHDIHLSGVFDSLVANRFIGLEKKRLTLGECLHDQLGLPETFLNGDIEDRQWNRRPLSSAAKGFAAQNVLFLQKMHAKLTRSALKM
ncbi:piRNA biogenesis protein EXD1 [Bradysia coprophila]|uniref:piRNA biogenesis protein EXD1 n=1 Tax=Bradysia coprophila TaxID=38358 RepID=UPI00187DCD0E|nr:piRNA biogenesis protein EXD1 [Bradysia coprophila]